MSAPAFPPLKWAQRPEYILLTVALQDAKDTKIELLDEGKTFSFSCSAGEKQYACSFELFQPVEPDESQSVVRPRQIELKLKKKRVEEEEELEWPRLSKTKKYQPQLITIDWSKWKDADDVGEDDDDLGDFGMGGDEDFTEKMIQQFKVPQTEVGGEEGEEEDMPPLEEDY